MEHKVGNFKTAEGRLGVLTVKKFHKRLFLGKIPPKIKKKIKMLNCRGGLCAFDSKQISLRDFFLGKIKKSGRNSKY